ELHKADETVVAPSGTVPLNTTMHDKATVSTLVGGPPTGTVDRSEERRVGSAGGAGRASGTGSAQVAGGAHRSSSQGPLAAGSYAFKAHYNGDTNYNA